MDTRILEARILALESRARRGERRLRVTWSVALFGVAAAFTLGWHKEAVAQGYGMTLAQAASRIAALEGRATNLETKTASMSAITDADGQPAVRFSGVNVQIVSGAGGTNSTVNGRGNLIVGYNEVSDLTVARNHVGSHNLVLGVNQTYTSYGGLVAGVYSTVTAPYGSVTGGQGNAASGQASAVSGGQNNTAGANWSSVSGGHFNTAAGANASVSGGFSNAASAPWSSISGGSSNTASGLVASVSGGVDNVANGVYSSVSGGPGRSVSSNSGWVAGRFTGTNYTGNFNSP